jgi:hypothetical protein
MRTNQSMKRTVVTKSEPTSCLFHLRSIFFVLIAHDVGRLKSCLLRTFAAVCHSGAFGEELGFTRLQLVPTTLQNVDVGQLAEPS